ncbi:MAG: hypothetical protein WB987_05855 [Candidatus Acidiferrales bacterium]
MYFRTTIVIAAVLAICTNAPDTTRARGALPIVSDLGPLPNLPVSEPETEIYMSVVQHTDKPSDLRPQSRLEIIRYVSGEFAKVVKPLPAGKKGYKVPVGKPIDDKNLQTALRFQGIAARPGDTVQITSIDFRPKEIIVQVNGGGHKKFHLRDHLQIGLAGGPVTPTTTTTTTTQAPPGGGLQEGNGAELILEYGRSVPDMSAEDLMHDLNIFLDFSKEHSAAVDWVESLPPQFKQAIKDHAAVEGMDHEMVLASLGRPDHKVRERKPSGEQTEDWIYGTPPAKTVFVTFSGDRVVKVKQYD